MSDNMLSHSGLAKGKKEYDAAQQKNHMSNKTKSNKAESITLSTGKIINLQSSIEKIKENKAALASTMSQN